MRPKLIVTTLCALSLVAALAAFALGRRNHVTRPSATARTFQVHGQIRSLDVSNRIIWIAHEEIPGYMAAMTMPLAVKDAALLKGLADRDDVQFELSVTDDDSWISHIERIPPQKSPASAQVVEGTVGQAADSPSAELLKGESVPDFNLTDQDGRLIHLSDLRGKAVVLTFIFTRCPLPNFCPLMSRNFAALQEHLNKEFPGRYQLLSVSIDPKFDRPEVLKEYAARYHADEKCWSFATGDQEQIDFVAGLFGLVHEPENGLIAHNLRTALIGPDGRLVHLWKSNVWTPYEVHRRVGEALSEPKTYSDARR